MINSSISKYINISCELSEYELFKINIFIRQWKKTNLQNEEKAKEVQMPILTSEMEGVHHALLYRLRGL